MPGARLIGISAELDGAWPVSGFDMSGLVRRLLLFDGYVIQSVRLLEFRHLGEHLGFARTRDLLASGLIEIRNEVMQPGEMLNGGAGALNYRLNWIDYHDRRESTSKALDDLRGIPGMSEKENISFRKAIVDRIRPLSMEHREKVATAFRLEVGNGPLIRAALRIALGKMGVTTPDSFFAEYELDTTKDLFRMRTDLISTHKLEAGAVHKAGSQALLGIGSLTQQICEMEYYQAISGFREEEAPLFTSKIGTFLATQASSEEKEQAFQKVLEVAKVPAYSYEHPLDVDRLLRVREDQNTALFRDWLAHGGGHTEQEIIDMLTSFKATIACVLEDRATSVLRFLMTTAAGLLPHGGPVVGAIASSLDAILGSVVPKSGVTGFIHRSYPSLFDRR